MSDKEFLSTLAVDLDAAPRTGAESDTPEGERRVILSDTCALMIAANVRRIAAGMQ